jgi:hypothetical protein
MCLDPLAACVHERFEAGSALFVATRFVWRSVATEAEGFFVHDKVDVF